MIMNDAYLCWKRFSKKTTALLTCQDVLMLQNDFEENDADFVFRQSC